MNHQFENLVAGASGMIGSAIARHLLAESYTIVPSPGRGSAPIRVSVTSESKIEAVALLRETSRAHVANPAGFLSQSNSGR